MDFFEALCVDVTRIPRASPQLTAERIVQRSIPIAIMVRHLPNNVKQFLEKLPYGDASQPEAGSARAAVRRRTTCDHKARKGEPIT